ncbi:MAG: exonuclease domain-containing protein, partial [Paraclostridium sp.]
KPQIYKDIHPFVGKMTHITIDQVKDAPTFPQVYKEFKKFISSKSNVFCIWGSNDFKELYRNIHFYSLPSKGLPKLYINVQQHASKFFNNPTGQSIGLQNAIQILDINEDKSYHDALNDAYYTSLIFKHIYNDDIMPETYMYNTIKPSRVRSKSTKRKIDYASLFEEFSKLLERELTSEDKQLIDLAYKMGKTHQFLIDDIDPIPQQVKVKPKKKNGFGFKKRR